MWWSIVALTGCGDPEPDASEPATTDSTTTTPPPADSVPTDSGTPASGCFGTGVTQRDGDAAPEALATDERLADHPELRVHWTQDVDADGVDEFDTVNTFDEVPRVVETVAHGVENNQPYVIHSTWSYGTDGSSTVASDRGYDGSVELVVAYFVGPDGQIHEADYDNLPSGPAWHYEYTWDAANRVATVRSSSDGVDQGLTTYTYDDDIGPDNTACEDDGHGPSWCTRSEYDGAGHLLYYATDADPGGALEYEWRYTWSGDWVVGLEYSQYGDVIFTVDTTWDEAIGLATQVVTTYPTTGDVSTDTWSWTCP